ncbi:hypothetical protein [Streptomyces abyssalis]|nr:hypothetical protein [Streptomyces abyssalis]
MHRRAARHPVRDRQEVEEMTSKVDRARVDKLLTEQDPFEQGRL